MHNEAQREKELEAKIKEMETRLEELEADTIKKENNKSEDSEFPIGFISAWRSSPIFSPQTVTFESFLANYNNGGEPGGGDGVLDLDSGVFTCLTSGYYSVSFSARGALGLHYPYQILYLFKNGTQLPESGWQLWDNGSIIEVDIEVIGSQIVVSNPLEKCEEKTFPPDSPPGCRRQPGAEDDWGKLDPSCHSQH